MISYCVGLISGAPWKAFMSATGRELLALQSLQNKTTETCEKRITVGSPEQR